MHHQTNKVGSFEDYGCHAGREYLFLLIFLGSIRTGAQAALRADKRSHVVLKSVVTC